MLRKTVEAFVGLVGSAAGNTTRARPVQRPARRLALEALEGRCVPSVSAFSLGGSDPQAFTPVGAQLFFSADDGVHGRELWVTDGTTQGTRLVKDIAPGLETGFPRSFQPFGDLLYFTARDAAHGEELWVTDGTEPGTRMVADLRAGSAGSHPFRLTVFRDDLFFTALDDEHGRELWKLDLTDPATGPELIGDLLPGIGSSDPLHLTVAGDQLFFTASAAVTTGNGRKQTSVEIGRELWASDGTAAGTRLVKDLREGKESSFPTELISFQGELFFAAQGGTLSGKGKRQSIESLGGELWKSDGTPEGTVLVKDINPGSAGSGIRDITLFQGEIVFGADDGVHGKEIWVSDGTSAGTRLLADLAPGFVGSAPAGFEVLGDRFFFTALDGDGGLSLGVSDGTAAGTRLSHPILSPNAVQNGAEVNVSLLAVGETLFFTALRENDTGVELWKTDGSAEGAVIVRDIQPGSGSSAPLFLTAFQGRLFFSADDGIHGREVWVSDGSEGGTVLLADVFREEEGS